MNDIKKDLQGMSVGELKKHLHNIPDDAEICLIINEKCGIPTKVIWCIEDNGVIIFAD